MNHQRLRNSFPQRGRRAGLITTVLAAGALLPLTATAQGRDYAEYPQTRGTVQSFKWDKLPSWMTLDMQLRGRTEGNSAFNDTPGNGRVYELTRVWGGLEVRPTSYLKGYLQFMDTHALGLPLSQVSSNQRDNFDLRQGYIEFHMKPVELYAGRKELKYGSERVIGISDFTNNSRTFDGFFGSLGSGKNKLDLFSTSVVTIHPTSLDKHGAGLTFHGAWAQLGSVFPRTEVEPFVLVRAVPRVQSQQGDFGSETEVTFGTEASGKLPAGFDFELMGDLQRGTYSTNSIHSGAGIAKLAYLAGKLPWSPRFGGEYDYATGNPHRNPDRISTYDQQYPSNHNAFGLEDIFGFQNITQSRINVDLGPTKNLSLLVQEEFLHAATTRDNVYASSGSTFIKAPAAGFASDDIGRGFDISAKYVFQKSFVVNAGLDYLSAGDLLKQNKHGDSPTYAYLSFTYRFKVDKQ